MAKTVTATYIDGKQGALFALHRPAHNRALSECFVIVPSFAEEMNRCRYMCTLFAQGAAAQGIGVLSVDPYGTGDSAGDFVDASWSAWQQDVLAACGYARSLGYNKLSILGIRLGALLAMEVIEEVQDLQRIILWQPVINGKNALTQFLRIRIAASLERDEEGGSVAEFEEQSRHGKAVEVAGYDVSPDLFSGIQQAALSKHLSYKKVPITWMNTLASEERKTPRAETQLIEQWQAEGANIELITVLGPSYWAVHERILAPALIDATLQRLAGKAP